MNLNISKIAVTFAGCFLGAGFLSGQEIYQFFGAYGIRGLVGIFFAVILMFAFGVLVMRLANIINEDSADNLIIANNNTFFKSLVFISQLFFLIGVSVIMVAGVGSLFYQSFGFQKQIISALFCIMLFFMINGGYNRMIRFFSITVPVLIISTFILCIYVIFTFRNNITYSAVNYQNTNNILLGTWWFSALSFVAYNIYSSIEILAPVGRIVYSKRKTVMGIAFGSLLLMITACSIFLSISVYPSCYVYDLPMLFLAKSVSPIVGVLYALLIFMGMAGTALSSSVAAVHFLESKKTLKLKYIYSGVVCIISFLASLFGFSNLIGTIYPICGYFGISALVLMFIHFLKRTSANK